MIPASVLARMATLGLTADQATEVAAMLADVEAATKDEAGAAIEARRRSDRERKERQRHGKSRDITGQDVTERDTPPSDKEIPPTPPKEINSPRETKTARGTRLPKDWVLPASWGKWALNEGHSEATIRLEADKFRDFWLSKSGKDATKVDWERTWWNWMRSVGERRGQQQAQAPPRPRSEFRQHQDDVQRELDKALGRKRDDEFTGQTFDLAAGDWRTH